MGSAVAPPGKTNNRAANAAALNNVESPLMTISLDNGFWRPDAHRITARSFQGGTGSRHYRASTVGTQGPALAHCPGGLKKSPHRFRRDTAAVRNVRRVETEPLVWLSAPTTSFAWCGAPTAKFSQRSAAAAAVPVSFRREYLPGSERAECSSSAPGSTAPRRKVAAMEL